MYVQCSSSKKEEEGADFCVDDAILGEGGGEGEEGAGEGTEDVFVEDFNVAVFGGATKSAFVCFFSIQIDGVFVIMIIFLVTRGLLRLTFIYNILIFLLFALISSGHCILSLPHQDCHYHLQ